MANSLAPKIKLMDQVRNQLRVRHLAFSTEKAYVHWILEFIFFHKKQHPKKLGKEHVAEFLTHLAVDRHVASSTQNQALSALLFLYRHVLDDKFGWLDGVVRTNRPIANRPVA